MAPLPRPAVAAGLVVGVLAVSTSAVLIRVAEAHPLGLAFWRSALGALALAPFAARSLRRGGPPDRAQRRQVAVAGVFLALHFALFISAIELTTVAAASVLVAMSPLFVAVGAAVFLREPPTRRTWVGIALAATGAVAVGAFGGVAAGAAPAPALGNALAVGGAATVAVYLLVGRAARRGLPVTVYACGAYAVSALVLLPLCVVLDVTLAGYSGGTWLAILGLVVGPQLLGHTIFNALLSTVSATVVAVTVLAEPVGATLLAAVLLGELPGAGFWTGAPVILVGVFLAATRGRGRRPRPRAPAGRPSSG
jgi:drug/metabolite transporter (DMT)-like permease